MFPFRERQGYPPIDAQQDDQHGLHGVYDEHEIQGVRVGHAVENEHSLHGKMPRAGPVGRGHDHGYAAHDERDEGARHAQVCRGVEAEEREVVVQEVAQPYSQGEKDEQRHVLDAAQRQHSLPNSAEGSFHLVVDAQSPQ